MFRLQWHTCELAGKVLLLFFFTNPCSYVASYVEYAPFKIKWLIIHVIYLSQDRKMTPKKRIKILKQRMSRPTRDTPLSDLNALFSLCACRAVAYGGAGGPCPPLPSTFPQKVKTCTNKS